MSRPIPTEALTILDIEMKFVRHEMVGECLEFYKWNVDSLWKNYPAAVTLKNGAHPATE